MEESEDEYAFYSGTGNDVLNDCGWIVDSGASSHMTWDRDVYCEYSELSTPQPVKKVEKGIDLCMRTTKVLRIAEM